MNDNKEMLTLEAVRAQLAAIVESSDDAIISKTLEGIITSWNRSAERLFGHTADEAIGQSILLLIPKHLRDEETHIIARLRKGERIDHFETQRITKDGRLLDISLTVSPVRDATGKIVGASKVARDITERKKIEQEREHFLAVERHAREEAQHINRMKDEFLATLSHELRTPLTAIMGWAQMLASGRVPPGDMVKAGEVIKRNANNQRQLIEDLLDMSRIVSGKLRLNVQNVYPIIPIEAAVETVRPSAVVKGIRIRKILDPLAGPISGDPDRLQQVIWNLVNNAVKFTPRDGTITIVLRRAESHVEISVTDSGEGIETDFLPNVFARFSQANSSATRKHGGLGLGLSIAKQIVELHGGTIHVTSEGKGKGAAFLVKMPMFALKFEESGTAPRTPSGRSAGEELGLDLHGLNILVVDDEPDVRDFISMLLEGSGATVRTAESGLAALDSVEDELPHLLISDIGMPEMDGYEFLSRLRGLGGTRSHIPAIALTAYARSEDRTRALRAGFVAHVAKPADAAELLATIAVLTGR